MVEYTLSLSSSTLHFHHLHSHHYKFEEIMPLISFSFLIFLLLTSASPSPFLAAAAKNHNGQQDLVQSSCVHASYPNLCLRTLSTYPGPVNTRFDLARAAVKVSIARTSRVANYLNSTLSGLKSKREKGALNDCVEQVSDSVDELSSTLAELKHLRGETFQWQMSNAQTWVSAALTNEDTCLDGFQDVDSKVKVDIRRKINNVSKVTSNALYMINLLNESGGRSRSSP